MLQGKLLRVSLGQLCLVKRGLEAVFQGQASW